VSRKCHPFDPEFQARRFRMEKNQKKALTTAAVVAGYIAWFMGKAMTSGIRTRKGTGRKF
jgi:hypothetical protein